MLCKDLRSYPNMNGGLLPCGQCMPCRINRRRDWTVRLILEAHAHEENSWVTFTYDDRFLPFDMEHKKLGRSFGSVVAPTLWRPDYQNFLKRFREKTGLTSKDFKYFISGEYGEKYGRPHYHACLFGIGSRYKKDIEFAWSVLDDDRQRHPIGNVFHGSLTWDSAQYTAGYTIKKMTAFDHGELDGRYPEFGQGSKGISLIAVDDVLNYMSIHRLNDVPDHFVYQGKPVPVPRYIKNKLRQKLGISNEESQAEWKADMRILSQSYQNSQAFKEGKSLKSFWLEENRQTLLNQDARLKLFYEKEKLL